MKSDLDLSIPPYNIRISTVGNVDALYDRLIAKGADHEDVRDERIPYWADLWHSALALARYLVASGIVQPGMRVTELGCGLGLSGIAAGLLGAELTFTDYMDEALHYARLNWQQNIPDRPAQFVRMDWRQPDPTLAADLILAADVVYEQRAIEPLLHTFKTLARPGGLILLSEPGRAVGKTFFEKLPAAGFTFSKTTVQETLKALTQTVHILKIRP
ncbi:MAG TPA: methyltransferase domain-containing protein [Saprospiraceae bacterium]|nr:methyltransferase domain-containing protein [Saprospiraceae bacterium]